MSKDKGKVEPAPQKPKGDWVTPRLTEHGSLKEITASAKIGNFVDPQGGGSFPG